MTNDPLPDAISPFLRKPISLDVETTGVDPLTARMVSIAVISGDGSPLLDRHVDPGIEIPAGAASVHGLTNETLANPMNHDDAVETAFYTLLGAAFRQDPVVVFNAPFDLSLLCYHAARLGLDRTMLDGLVVIDPLAISRWLQPTRVQPRKLEFLCSTYGVVLTDAHDAAADALAAQALAQAMYQGHLELQETTLPAELMHHQATAHMKHVQRLRRIARKVGRSTADMDVQWPIRFDAIDHALSRS